MVGAWTGDAIEGLVTQVLRAHWASRPHCTRYLAGIAGQAGSGATPTKHHVIAGLASPCTSREALRPVSAVRSRSKPRSWPGWNAARSSHAPGIGGIGTSLIPSKSSLIRNDESLISRKNSLFTNVGNLPLSR